MEDVLFPALRLSTHERALYVHLLRHSRLEGRRTVRVSRNDLARAIGLCASTSRHYLRTLARKQVVRFLDRSGHGCLLEILLPNEITAGLAHSPASKELVFAVREVERDSAGQPRAWPRSGRYRGQRFRARILHREGGRCFYCRQVLPVPLGVRRLDAALSSHRSCRGVSSDRASGVRRLDAALTSHRSCRGASSDPPSRVRRLDAALTSHRSCRGASFASAASRRRRREDPPSRARRSPKLDNVSSATWALDHVVPVCHGGDSTSSNLVAACFSCNSQKGQLSAKDFVRSLRRKKVVSSTQFTSFLRRLRSLRHTT